jgi:sporulation protein YlmC with PRC-barrel domain
MRPSELQGKSVVDSEAKILGTVRGVEIDCSEWKVTHIRIELTDEMIELLGYKKPFLGGVEISSLSKCNKGHRRRCGS